MTPGVIRSLLTQAREQQRLHRWTGYERECVRCSAIDCPERVFADAVVPHLESLAARDTQIRRLAQTMLDAAVVQPPDLPLIVTHLAEDILVLLDAGVPMGGGEPACPE